MSDLQPHDMPEQPPHHDTPEQLQHMIDGRDQTINELYQQTSALTELLAEIYNDRRRILEDAKEVEHTSDRQHERIQELGRDRDSLLADARRLADQAAAAERRAYEAGKQRDYLAEHGPAIEGARASMHLLAKAIGQPELAECKRPQHARIARTARERIKQLEGEARITEQILQHQLDRITELEGNE